MSGSALVVLLVNMKVVRRRDMRRSAVLILCVFYRVSFFHAVRQLPKDLVTSGHRMLDLKN